MLLMSDEAVHLITSMTSLLTLQPEFTPIFRRCRYIRKLSHGNASFFRARLHEAWLRPRQDCKALRFEVRCVTPILASVFVDDDAKCTICRARCHRSARVVLLHQNVEDTCKAHSTQFVTITIRIGFIHTI